MFGGSSEEHPISVKSAQRGRRAASIPRSTSRSTIGITPRRRLEALRRARRGLGERLLPSGRAVTGPERARVARPGAGTVRDDRPRPGVPRPARQARRGRRDPGPAGALRHPLRGLRRPELGAVHGQVAGLRRRQERGDRHAAASGPSTRRTRTVDPDRLTYPVFVKPARSGSSFGVSKVTRAGGAAARGRGRTAVRLEGADRGGRRRQRGRLRHPGRAVRSWWPARSTGSRSRTASSGSTRRGRPSAAPRTRPSSSPPTSPPRRARSSRRPPRPSTAPWGARDWRGSTCSSRRTGRVVLNEVNTLPGMTSYSRYPRMMAAAGLPLAEVIDRLVALTLHGKKR